MITFGTFYGGADIARAAWPHAIQSFSVNSSVTPHWSEILPDRPVVPSLGSQVDRLPRQFLDNHRVDVLLVQPPPPQKDSRIRRGGGGWERLIARCHHQNRPPVVVVFESAKRLADGQGYGSKAPLKRFERYGYDSVQWFVQDHALGGSVVTDYAVTILHRSDRVMPPIAPLIDPLPPRPMKNNLQHHGIPFGVYRNLPSHPKKVKCSSPSPFVIAGTIEGGVPVFDDSGPMPNRVGSLIYTDARGRTDPSGRKRRIRRLQTAELAKAKGLPSSWGDLDRIPISELERMPGIHTVAAIGEAIFPLFQPSADSFDAEDGGDSPPIPPAPIDGQEEEEEWTWELPDLSPESEWTKQREANLRSAISGRPNEQKLWEEGRQMLERHRQNYGPDGPKQLQILWWEWPQRHWEMLRRGCPMNFVSYPPPQETLVPNGDFDEETLPTAVAFVEELISLGVLVPASQLKATAPIFVIPKAGQPGQWRVIANLKEGGQNAYMAPDPVHLPRSQDILPLLCAGGYSAVIDLSKYFYQFPTAAGDQQYLGCIHPATGEFYFYGGLPMGAGSSPGISGRFGAAMVRVARENDPETFSGVAIMNHPCNLMEKGRYRPEWGTGRLLIGSDGLPSAWSKIHVDDIFVHGPTKKKCGRATISVLDTIVRLGLIIHSAKLEPPTQTPKYCGFLYDHTGVPKKKIPRKKRARAISCIRYVRSSTMGARTSRLAWAGLVGLLQSLVPATPSRIGASYLRGCYDDLYQVVAGELDPTHPWFFLQDMMVSDSSWRNMDWWERILLEDVACPARPSDCATLAVTWGDGSGTGTGYTEQLLSGIGPCPPMQMTMGTWSTRVHSFSSNWKELRTLKLVLERDLPKRHFHRRLLFYFTDNIVTYFIVCNGTSSSPALMDLARDIKRMEMTLECQLIAVHVPGTLMILQCTDGLSRGLWGARERLRALPHHESAQVFRSIDGTHAVHYWMVQTAAITDPSVLARKWRPVTFDDEWGGDLIGQNTLWCLSPLEAAQAIDAAMMAYVEAPSVTSAIFLVPRVMQRDWQRVSKYCVELGVFSPSVVPTIVSHDIPFVLCYIQPHHPTLQPRRESVDRSAIPSYLRRHLLAADTLRGMQGDDVDL